jgi:hypothetical protein
VETNLPVSQDYLLLCGMIAFAELGIANFHLVLKLPFNNSEPVQNFGMGEFVLLIYASFWFSSLS